MEILASILSFVSQQAQLSAQEKLEQIKALAQIALGFQQATTPNFQKVSPFVNTLTAIIRPGITILVVLVRVASMIWPQIKPIPYDSFIVLSWFGLRTLEKGADIVSQNLANGNGNGK